MSSSNSVALRIIEETTYGETPVAGNFESIRYTSETLSGSPQTTESQTIRTDRASSGQVVTGLDVGGGINNELAKDAVMDMLLASAMFSTWVIDTPVAADLTIDATLLTITRAAGNWNTDVFIGAIITITGMPTSANNTQVMVTEITSNTVIKIVGPDTLVTEADTGDTFYVADYLAIGTTKKSFSIEKAFTELTTKAINYRGMIVSTLSLNIAYGALVTASVELMGNDHELADLAAEFMTNGRTINAAATTNSLNGSVDMPFLANSAGGTFIESPFCVNSLEINLNNNLRPQTCIGQVEPDNYNSGKAQIEVSINAYFEDTNFNLLTSKLLQTAFAVGGMVKNSGGFYGFYMPALQVSFDDPNSPGENQDVFINMSGVAKVGAAGEKPLYIFRG